MDFWISRWISGFRVGFLDFKLDFWISRWISGFQIGFLDFVWISRFLVGFLDFALDFGFLVGFLLTVYEISGVSDPSDGYQCKLAITRERQRFSKIHESNRDSYIHVAILFVPSLWRRSEHSSRWQNEWMNEWMNEWKDFTKPSACCTL